LKLCRLKVFQRVSSSVFVLCQKKGNKQTNFPRVNKEKYFQFISHLNSSFKDEFARKKCNVFYQKIFTVKVKEVAGELMENRVEKNFFF
jgi:hypothetical protein